MRTTRKWRTISRALAIVAVAAAGTACASLQQKVFKEPVVNFRELRVTGLGLTGGALEVELSVYNPNSFKLDATRLTYTLFVDNVQFGSGALDSKFVVNEGDSSIVRLPMTFSYAGVGSAGRQAMQNGVINYRVSGDVTVGTPLGSFTRAYDRNGQYTVLSGRTR